MNDMLAALNLAYLSSYYRRLADSVDKNKVQLRYPGGKADAALVCTANPKS